VFARRARSRDHWDPVCKGDLTRAHVLVRGHGRRLVESEQAQLSCAVARRSSSTPKDFEAACACKGCKEWHVAARCGKSGPARRQNRANRALRTRVAAAPRLGHRGRQPTLEPPVVYPLAKHPCDVPVLRLRPLMMMTKLTLRLLYPKLNCKLRISFQSTFVPVQSNLQPKSKFMSPQGEPETFTFRLCTAEK
jgi:hypothetical protein